MTDSQREDTIADVARGLSRIIKATDDFSKRAQSEYGVTGPQLWALWELRATGGMTVSALANQMYVHPSTVSGIAERLEAKGLVERRRSREDQRVVQLVITPAGEALLGRTPSPARRRLLDMLHTMPDRDLRALNRGLAALADALSPAA